MKTPRHQSADELAIRSLFARWTQAVRDEDRDGIRADHHRHILMFDVPAPFLSRGIDAYMATWDTFFRSQQKPVQFDFTSVEVTVGSDVAFLTAVGHCMDVGANGRVEPLEFRLTMGLRKASGIWCVTHEHHSLPAA